VARYQAALLPVSVAVYGSPGHHGTGQIRPWTTTDDPNQANLGPFPPPSSRRLPLRTPKGGTEIIRRIALAAIGAALAVASFVPAGAAGKSGGNGGGGKPGGGTMPAASVKGLCIAYFAGSSTGQANKRNAPPFEDLAAKADAADQSVEEFCGRT
jgi:hypothetical protein